MNVSTGSGPNFWRKKAASAAIVAALVAVALTWRAYAQDAGASYPRTYKLQHAQATEMAAQVRDVLKGVPGNPQATVDRANNALIVQGGDEAQRLAAQLIGAFDRAAPPGQNAPPAAERTVKTYSVDTRTGERTLLELKRKFPASTGATFTLDRRTGQVVVVASSEIQTQVAQQPGVATAAAETASTGNAPVQPGVTAIAGEGFRSTHPLKNITWQTFEDFVSQLWGNKVQMATNRTGEVASIRLKNAAGTEAVAQIDRRHNELSTEGSQSATAGWTKVFRALDSGPVPRGQAMKLVPVHKADPQQVSDTISLLKRAMAQPRGRGQRVAARSVSQRRGAAQLEGTDLLARIFQQEEQEEQEEQEQPEEFQPDQPPDQPPPDQPPANVGGPVQIEFIPELDIVIIKGRREDVERVQRIIADIERESQQSRPEIEIVPINNVDAQTLGDLIIQLYNSAFAGQLGRISITPLDKPNVMILVGRRETIDEVKLLIRKLDQPVEAHTQFRVFPLQFADSAEAAGNVTTFFATRGPLASAIQVTADYRTNSVIVFGSKNDIAEVERLLTTIDTGTTLTTDFMRTFPLRYAYAADLAPMLQAAILGQPYTPPAQGGAGGFGGQVGQQNQLFQPRMGSLRLVTVDRDGQRTIESTGIVGDIRIYADTNRNAIIARGPERSMELIGALITELDQLPGSQSQIKVFQIINGDATSLTTMLQQTFGQQQQGGGGVFGGGGLGGFFAPITAGGDNTLVPLRFSTDTRTNSIIATGSPSDLTIVEAILLRLDETGGRRRITEVIRLKNSPADLVATSITNWLTQLRQVNQLAGTQSLIEQLEQEVIIVPETVTNTLIISATPRYFEMVRDQVIKVIDRRPPMVMIQVVIAEVSLNDFEEFGVEFGLQDSLLFSRTAVANGASSPGFNFNNAPLGSGAGPPPGSQETLAGQALSTFALGRVGTEGFGGLVLSASNESISILLRTLQSSSRLQVLSRPQIMTLDNQIANIQIGQQVPYATGTTNGINGLTTSTTFIDVGLLLSVQPRTSDDGMVVMDVAATNSDLSDTESIPISFGPNGEVISQPIINTINADTTVMARSGQTIIIGGLIKKTRGYVTRRVPYLSDIPILGRIFRYDSANEDRNELLIILTPHIIRSEAADADWMREIESDRMSWCLADVIEMHGNAGLSGGYGLWGPADAPIIFPDVDPTGMGHGDMIMPSTMQGAPLGSPVPSALKPSGPVPVEEPNLAPPAMLTPSAIPQGAASQRRKQAPMEPPLPTAAARASANSAWFANTGPRVERSDNATVTYGPPPKQDYAPQWAPPVLQSTQPPAEVAPTHYQQSPPAGNYGSSYIPNAVQPASWRR